MRFLLLALFVLLASALAGGCGASAVCGNGDPEVGEQCDDGNLVDDDLCTNLCVQPGEMEAAVIWAPLLANVFPGFVESCGGVRATEIELKVTGPLNFTVLIECASGRTPIRGLLPGSYNVVGTLYHTDLQTNETTAVTRGLAQTIVELVNVNVEVTLDFSFDDFIDSYVGAFFFRVRWAAMDVCGAVQALTMRLERGGVPLSGLDGNNNSIVLDGLTSIPCSDFSAAFPYSLKDLEWGPAQVTLRGLDGIQTVLHAGTFDTFVGAGVSNPEIHFDVGPDAAVPDAGPDAAL